MYFGTRAYDERLPASAPVAAALFSRTSKFRPTHSDHRRLRVDVASFSTPGASALRVLFSDHEIELVDSDNITVMLPGSGAVEVGAGDHRYVAALGSSLTFLPSSRHTAVRPGPSGPFTALMLKLPVAVAGRTPRLAPNRSGGPAIATVPAAMASLCDLLNYVMNDLAAQTSVLSRPGAALAAEILLLEQFRAAFPVPESKARGAASAQAERIAEEFMQENFARPLSMTDVAEACGMGIRALQSTFRRCEGTTPRKCLAVIRLDHAHLRLLAGEKSITEVALDCGFVHLGRFSKEYWRRFGELPSQTAKLADMGLRTPQ